MSIHPHNTIPVELMEILNRINDNVNEVKERMARLEAQDHSESIKSLRHEIEKERDQRISLQIELAGVKTRLAPILVAISTAAAVIIEVLVRSIH